MRARATLAWVEGELRATGAEATIHVLWVALADRAGRGTSRTCGRRLRWPVG